MITPEDRLDNNGYDYDDVDYVVFRSPDYAKAMIGMSHDDRVIYDYEKMVQSNMEDGMTEDEARDFILYNLSYHPTEIGGAPPPIVMFPFLDNEEMTFDDES